MEGFLSCKQIEELAKTLLQLTFELQNRIKENHDILIFQATWVGLLNSALDILDKNMVNFRTLTNKAKSKAVLQYCGIEKQSNILGKVCVTIHKIRSCSKIINLIKKVKNKNTLPNDTLTFKKELILQDKSIKKFRFMQNEIFYLSALSENNNKQTAASRA